MKRKHLCQILIYKLNLLHALEQRQYPVERLFAATNWLKKGEAFDDVWPEELECFRDIFRDFDLDDWPKMKGKVFGV